MKKILLLGIALLGSYQVQAQYLPNSGFENWKGDGSAGKSYQTNNPSGERQRPGDEPATWNGSSINQAVKFLITITKEETLIYKVDSEQGRGSAVKMQNKYVGISSAGSNAPAFVTLGTPWVHASATKISDSDGGTYGGTTFSNRPDAIQGRFKRTAGSAAENAYIIAYLWNGTFKSKIGSKSSPSVEKEDVDRAILGKVTPTQSGTLVASCEYAFPTTTDNGWQTITVPLTYVTDTENVNVEKMNVVLSAGDYWTRENIQENSILEADDVQFVYYSELESVTYDGESVSVVEAMDLSTKEYDASKLELKSNGKFATIKQEYVKETGLLTITVRGNDWSANPESQHVYTIQFMPEMTMTDAAAPTKTGLYYVTLERAFKQGWNTVCLPFDYTLAAFGEGAVAQEFTSVSDGLLNFTEVTTGELKANVPYLLYLPTEVAGPLYFGVEVQAATPAAVTYGDFTFQGTYAPMSMAGLMGVTKIDGVDKVVIGGAGATIKGTRAYFTSTSGIKEMLLSFDGVVTGIESVTGTSIVKYDVFTLTGVQVRKQAASLNGLPKGIYIVNGKKTVIE